MRTFAETAFQTLADLPPEKDREKYDICRVIRAEMREEVIKDGIEGEHRKDLMSKNPGTYTGCPVPWWAAFPTGRKMQRDMQAGVFSQGGAMIGTQVGEPIDVLRNLLVTGSLGATILTDLTQDITLPRTTQSSTVSSLPQIGQIQSSTQIVDGIYLTPHRVGVDTQFSKQLDLQSGVSVRQFILNDLQRQIAVKLDSLALQGRGSLSEPTGLVNQIGVGSITFGGAATFSKVLDFEQALSANNAEQPTSRIGWAVHSTCRNTWKKAARVPTGGSAVYPSFIWDTVSGAGGMVNGYPAIASNQMLSGSVIFGDWTQLIIGLFGGLDIVVNPYSRAKEAIVGVTCNMFVDVGVGHGESFCVSADSGAQ